MFAMGNSYGYRTNNITYQAYLGERKYFWSAHLLSLTIFIAILIVV